MIQFKNPYGHECMIAVLSDDFHKRVHFTVDGKYPHISVWDIITAKKVAEALQQAIANIENDK